MLATHCEKGLIVGCYVPLMVDAETAEVRNTTGLEGVERDRNRMERFESVVMV